jgi:MinD-like ATPase involved in chromosome partitioning or flagellar assembly
MIVTVASVRGSPGVTSWSLLLAAAWPPGGDRERVVVEADLDGGVVGARYGFGVDPGAVSLIAALRYSREVVPVGDHGRRVGEGVWVVPGPEVAEQARAVWAGTAGTMAARLAADDRVWLVDAGRAQPGSETFPLVSSSQLLVLVCRDGPEDFVQVPHRVAVLGSHAARVAVLVVGHVPYTTGDLREFFGSSAVWNVRRAEDLAGLAGAVQVPGRARRTWVWRHALEISAHAAALAETPEDTPAMDGRRAGAGAAG